MRVKRLEIQGFKSFKDKTIIHFDHGITGIVGPNGCGKSNIVDAFFWVMGEQSYKHMRGSGSDDLIFNGSSKYSPLGMAEATMVLESETIDTENAAAGASTEDTQPHFKTKEIAVTRRLYRGGEGEYFINGVSARLKDIHELFMDTGVGAKGYSVIEQGQIGKIVNSKPEERRLLIEEAAGIAKYKARKKESLRKLEAAQGNLSRLNDVIQEIERTLASLDRQAQKARQYRKYKDELLDKEMTWGRRKILVLRQKLESLRRQKDVLEQEVIGLKAELQTQENNIEVDRIAQLTETKEAEVLQAKIQQLADDLAHEKSALDLSRRRQSDLAAQLQSLETEKEGLEESITSETERLQSAESEAEEAQVSFQTVSIKVQELDEQVRQVRQEADISRRSHDQKKRDLMNGISQTSHLSSKAASLLGRIESANAQVQRLSQQIEIQVEKVNSLREEVERITVKAEETRQTCEALRLDHQSQNQTCKEQEELLRQTEKERDQAHRTWTQLRSKLESLEELEQAREGFGDASKAALEWAKQSGASEKLIPLADLLEVQSGYETAIEGWFESRLEQLISLDAPVAMQALQRVRDEKSGRVAVQVGNTQPIQVGTSGTQTRALLEKYGFKVVGELTDFVTIPENATAGHEFAMRTISNVWVVESFDPMAEFLASGDSAQLGCWAIVSTTGDALDSNGTLRGGSSTTEGAGSAIRRKRAIADLKKQTTEARARHQALEEAVVEGKAKIEELRARVQQILGEVQSLQVESAAYDRDIHQMNRALKDAENQLAHLEGELVDVQNDAESAREQHSEIEVELQQIISSRAELEQSISEEEAILQAKEVEVRSQESELQVLRVSEASMRERSQSLRRELESGRALIADRKRRLTEIDRTLDRATSERAHFTGNESQIAEKVEELTLSLAASREMLSGVKDRIEQSSAQVNIAMEQIKDLHKSSDRKTSQANQLALEIEKISSDTSHLIQNLEEKYGPGCLDRPVQATPPETETPIEGALATESTVAPEAPALTEMSAEEEQVLFEEVERLRERIRRLGDVNPEAVEQFEESKKRYDYLTHEKSDLERSIENLQEAIEHINKTSEDRFRRAFEAIADRFERLFPIIFGGGQAKLSLVYPEGSADILEAGVDILAQPPGKKVVNIGLLSGGEKALTAVSLIFAIFMVKPSPFCVLDEVDAPLDDANIGKFNALLREMSAKSQFIVITHNKKTMELNDTLYGVTMEEPGVSKMVSIELK